MYFKGHFYCFIIYLMLLLPFFSFKAAAQAPNGKTYYVVIGAFFFEDNARRFLYEALKDHLDAHLRVNEKSRLHYIYVLETSEKALAVEKAKMLQGLASYSDAWVYESGVNTGEEAKEDAGSIVRNTMVADIQNVVKKDSISEKSSASSPDNEDGSKNFIFQIIDEEGKVIDGKVDVIDVDKARKFSTYKGNEEIILKPVNKSGNLMLQCPVFGYRKGQVIMDFNKPMETLGALNENGKYIIPIEMIRLRKGDITPMYNVFFFKDGAAMRPESKFEINELLEMMKENPTRKIMVHGHTNGNRWGKIIVMGDKKNFFSLSDSKIHHGSAKKLSQARADIIVEYLINNGIDASRMVTKAWGGKKGVRGELSERAVENVRVEIEILED